jgi:hypothetical protein
MTRTASPLTPSGLSSAELVDELGIDRSSSDLVVIDREQVDRMAGHLRGRVDSADFKPARWDDPLFWNVEATDERRSQYFAIGSALNFRFWDLRDGQLVPAAGSLDGQRYGGAMYMWRCLRRADQRQEVDLLDCEVLSNLSDREFAAVFTDDFGNNPLAVAGEDRLANLRDLGDRLHSEWDGLFFNVVRASGGSLAAFAGFSNSFRAFDDPVYKLTMVNAILHSGSNIYRFRDEPLPAIDYHLLRHALRQGLIRPSSALALKLTKMNVLADDEARELRRVALLAYVDLATKAAVSGELLDNAYWRNRVNCTDVPVCVDPQTADRCPFLAACERFVGFALPIEFTRYY